ncbi:MAG: DUF4062 domain-containing protein [Chlorobiales bacterium]|nr:DUF4062 domain-containing protein [Chlorobiales bacterium]
MIPIRIFISSVEKEFSSECEALRDYLRSDALMRRFFEPFLLAETPAVDRRPDELNLSEVEQCDIYLGLFGNEYGDEDAAGLSSTERAFDAAASLHKSRLIFVKEGWAETRHPKIEKLIQRAGKQLIMSRFTTSAELLAGVYAALVQMLEIRQLLRTTLFDAAVCHDATLADLDDEAISRFIRNARWSRGFPLQEELSSFDLLTHLNLLNNDRPTQGAVLLFGKHPQRFLISSEVKCAHFHGTQIAKPIPSFQVYKWRAFELVDQAVDFILSKIDITVGTRADSTEVPVTYEIPPEVVREAIVNAVVHRDYASSGSVQVMLFADRLEVWNPGTLPPSLTLEQLRKPHGSVLPNPLLAESFCLARYIERMGTGIGDMISLCRKAGLRAPDFSLTDGFVVTIWRKQNNTINLSVEESIYFTGEVKGVVTSQVTGEDKGEVSGQVIGEVAGQVTGEVVGEVGRLVSVLHGEMKRTEIMLLLGLRSDDNFRNNYLVPSLKAGLIEMTVPDKPNSRLQKYRLTKKGMKLLTKH